MEQLVRQQVELTIKSCPVVVFSLSYCQYCKLAKNLLIERNTLFQQVEVDQESSGQLIRNALIAITGRKTFPSIFVKGQYFGGYDTLRNYYGVRT